MDTTAPSRSTGPVFPSPVVATTSRTIAVRPRAMKALGLTPRRPVTAGKGAEARSLQRFVRQEYWNGLAAGDVVRIAGHAARGRHWRFRAHVTNTSNGATWVEVALVDGPPPAKRPIAGEDELEGAVHLAPRIEKVRSFEPDLVAPRWKPRGRPRLRGRSGRERQPDPAGSSEAAGSSGSDDAALAGPTGEQQPSLF